MIRQFLITGLVLLSPSYAAEPSTVTHDCLAEVCLDTRATIIPTRTVFVADYAWERIVEICAERVVRVTLSAAWALGVTKAVHEGLLIKNWYELPPTSQLYYNWNSYTYCNSNIKECRHLQNGTMVTATSPARPIVLSTTHADYASLCAAKKSQGL